LPLLCDASNLKHPVYTEKNMIRKELYSVVTELNVKFVYSIRIFEKNNILKRRKGWEIKTNHCTSIFFYLFMISTCLLHSINSLVHASVSFLRVGFFVACLDFCVSIVLLSPLTFWTWWKKSCNIPMKAHSFVKIKYVPIL